ncbi:MAG: hypothetical protein QY323_02645 [Patescibacteria group bacterium]|nr:MAG: hypothetical protein QY323_02645 [Patescibacteria group bacterium]
MKILIQKAHGHAKRHYHKHYKTRYQERAHLVFLLDAALVTIALALLGLALYFRFAYHPLRDDFKLSLITEQTIVSGTETAFSVRIVNSGKTKLHGAKMAVHLPKAFVPTEAPDRYDAASGEIAIGEMVADVSSEYRFRGTLLGPAGSADVYVHFTAQNDEGQSDETLTKGSLRWESNAIETRFDMPEAIVPGQAVTFALRVKNGSALTFENAAITPTWPEGFKLRNATPPLYRGTVALGLLEAGEEVEVKFSGRFDGAADLFRLGAALHGTLRNEAFVLSATQADIRMAAVDLKLEAAFAEDAPVFVRPGQDVAILVRYHNDGVETIRNLSLAIAPDVNTLGEVLWETSNRIASLGAGERGERKAFVRVREAVSRYAVNPVFRAVPQATFSIDDPKIVDARVSGSAVETKISGMARLRAVARYYTSEGDQIGRGPLPPRVGKVTSYWIFTSLETGATETQDGIVTFRLPQNVVWTGRAAVTVGQDLASEGDRLVWRLGATDPHAGILHEAPSASFEVALTPSSDQLGTAPGLLSEAAYSGHDTWTDDVLTSHQGALTTTLTGDSAVAGRTHVKP